MSAEVTRRHREKTALCHQYLLWDTDKPYDRQLLWIKDGDTNRLRLDEQSWPVIAQAIADTEAAALASQQEIIDELRTEHASLSQHFIEDQNRLAAIAAAPQPVKAEGWILCAQRMPKHKQQVLFWSASWVINNAANFGVFISEEFEHFLCESEGDEIYELREVTHWMPLPAPPEQGQKSDG